LKEAPSHFFNRLLIAGHYVDPNGKLYSFEQDGSATWGKRQFQYEINRDYLNDDLDFFYCPNDFDSTRNSIPAYHFQWRNDTLLLFKERFSDEERAARAFETAPFLILTRIGAA
jgi:hypothetical protein